MSDTKKIELLNQMEKGRLLLTCLRNILVKSHSQTVTGQDRS